MPSYQRYDGVARDYSGNVLPGASIQVNRLYDGSAAEVYSDEMETVKPNPLTAASDGSFSFYGKDDDYTLVATLGASTFTLDDVTLSMEHVQYKTTKTDLVNDGTLNIDADFTFPAVDGAGYYFRMVLYVTTTLNAQFRYMIAFTGGGAPAELHEEIIQAAKSVDGVLRVHQVITEHVGPEIVADLHININGDLPLFDAHDISDEVHSRVTALTGIDRAYVHVEPCEVGAFDGAETPDSPDH